MAGWADNDRPPTPQGLSGEMREERGIVPRNQRQGEKDGRHVAPSLPAGLFFCALGGAVASSMLSFVGPALVSYGYYPVAPRGGVTARLGCLVAMLAPAVALTFASGISAVASAVVACLLAVLVCELAAARRMTPGALCAVVAAGTVVLLGVDEALALASGTTLSAGVGNLLNLLEQQLDGALVGASDQIRAARAVIEVVWPLAYVMAALAGCVSAVLGALVASRLTTADVEPLPRLADFDLPLWVVAVFVASLAGLAVAVSTAGAVSGVALAISANVALAVRLALTVQGLAVVTGLARSKGVGSLGTALIGVVALYLEVQFVVLTIAGLVDVWANFRHLQRGGRPGVAGQSMQD